MTYAPLVTERPAPGSDLRRFALFLDFDGTLVEIAGRPDGVVVDPSLPGVLARLREQLGGALAIVTGRAISDVDGFLTGLGLDICGLHGLERRVGNRISVPDGLVDLGADIAELEDRLAAYPGVLVENKKVGVAVHWRLAPAAEAEVRAIVDDLATRLGPGYRLQGGKAVLEIVPAAAGKGAGIEALMAAAPYQGRIPIFIGDDRTDEDGFRAISALGGISVKIGEGDTLAEHRLDSTDSLQAWLADWLVGTAGVGGLPRVMRHAGNGARPSAASGTNG